MYMVKKHTLYLDMDGVVADWVGRVTEILGRRLTDPTVRYSESEWSRIRNHERIYSELQPISGSEDLVNIARRYRDELGWELLFLTAIPHLNDIPWVFWDKVVWVQRYFPDIAVHFGPHSADKWQHCREGDILVDDRSDNCAQWVRAGGIAVQVWDNDIDRACVLLQQDFDRRLSMVRIRELSR